MSYMTNAELNPNHSTSYEAWFWQTCAFEHRVAIVNIVHGVQKRL